MNIYPEDLNKEELLKLHEIVLELYGRTGGYVNQLVEVEDFLFQIDEN